MIHFFTSGASCSVQVCRAPSRRRKCRKETSTPLTTTIDDRSAPSYERTATLDRIAQKFSLSRGSVALKSQVLAPPGLVAPFDAMLLALIEDCIRSDASANLCKTVTDSFIKTGFFSYVSNLRPRPHGSPSVWFSHHRCRVRCCRMGGPADESQAAFFQSMTMATQALLHFEPQTVR